MSKKRIQNTVSQPTTTKRIVIVDRNSLIARNWQKHRVPMSGYFKGSQAGAKRAGANREHVVAE